MRFVAGRGAVAKLLQAGDRRHRGLPAGTLQRRAIGKMLLARGAAAKSHREASKERALLQAGKEHPVLQANKKESGKTHSLKPALVMTALVRVTGARPRGSSQLLLCFLELLW